MAYDERFKRIFDAARDWSDRCLVEDESVADGVHIWTARNLADLDTYYVKNLDTGSGDFMTKLESQLAPASPEAKRLMAEIFWAMYLFTSSLKPATKELKIRRVWEWSGLPFPENSPFLDVFFDGGIGSTGPGFQNHFWMEVLYFVQLLSAFKSRDKAERRRLIGDPWEMAIFLDDADTTNARQLRHMLLYILFPQTFERISSRGNKRDILLEFLPPKDKAELDFKDRRAVDKALLSLRTRLEGQYGEGFDYYRTPEAAERWMGKSNEAESLDDEASLTGERGFGVVLPEPYEDARFWVIAPGRHAKLWGDFIRSGKIAICFEEFGPELANLDKKAIYDKLLAVRSDGTRPTMDTLAAWEFSHVMRPGDYVFAKRGASRILGFGRVKSGYEYDSDFPEYHHVRSVEWIKTGVWDLDDAQKITQKTLTEFTEYRNWLAYALSLLGLAGSAALDGDSAREARPEYGPAPVAPYTRADVLRHAFIDESTLSDYMRAWECKKNLALSGSPGTGKSWLARRLAWLLLGCEDEGRLLSVQFHQSYSYEDFVRGWRPQDGRFELVDGPFLSFCERARKDSDRKYVVLIDEMNRGNLSRIFGELLSLLEADKRTRKYAVRFANSRPEEPDFFIPPNLYILGTMNSADRSLAVVDYALRRRFAFRKLEPAYGRDEFENYLSDSLGVDSEVLKWIESVMPKLNEAISEDPNLGPDYRVGHSFFSSADEAETLDRSWCESVVRGEILPLLEEYWFDEREKVQEWKKTLLP